MLRHIAAKRDKQVMVTTWSLGLFTLILFVLCFTTHKDEPQFLLFPALVLSAMLIISYCFSPKAYSVDHEAICIHKGLGKKCIALAQVRDVKYLTATQVGRLYRSMGNGGVFGYTGLFYANTLGRVTCYITRQDEYVYLLLQSGKQILLTPNHAKLFAESIPKA